MGSRRRKRIFLSLAIILSLLGLEITSALAAVTPLRFRGICYSPFRDGQAPGGVEPTKKQVTADLTLLAKLTPNIRTFSCEGIQGQIPSLARAKGLTVVVGIWLSGNETHDLAEIQRGVLTAKKNTNVCAITVGSEVLLRGNLTLAKLIEYINLVKGQVKVPVGTAEVYGKWLENPGLATAADFLMVNIYPYWEGVSASNAAAFSMSKYNAVAAASPDKPVIIGEAGWPTSGETVGQAVPGEGQQAQYIREFVQLALDADIAFFLFEAFDEVWKTIETGLPAESHWGIFDSQRQLKLPMAGLIAAPPLMLDLRGAGQCGAANWSGKNVKGYIYGGDPITQRVVIYASTNAWYVQPLGNKPYTKFNKTGYFTSRTHRGDEYAALLVPKEFRPPSIEYGADPPWADDYGVQALLMARRLCDPLPPPLNRLLEGK